ncbi:hypothetical protein TVAG_113660 [Trichomonas vaginalis G3]|uniref:Uncharacterized protein n=1 Tax=Trichomonas vaginalis (strain ATCC PRA-98 / G3) TaxID=412133 RepID=A2DNL9_TRIV3|nr:hypothetical protein TVAGG3_0608410 [Trichomonas vaginalis G3]EAY18022.1 hypothetical protein TVAG_113660 [Trichomonas vaginalis G3]KAI5524420.1 hypothetical protein TVAGG3_0608410 [Trichomonas vaginalis G3]|eukprot:XP_001579008.1 hypothetical protein [Trichomonas vaginalis G3]
MNSNEQTKFVFLVVLNFSLAFTYLMKTSDIRITQKTLPSLFYGIVTTQSSAGRQRKMMKNWMKKIFYPHDYAFITEIPLGPNLTYHYLPPYQKYLRHKSAHGKWLTPHQDRGSRRMTGMEYFYYNTTIDYYWSMTDDIPVDYESINRLLYYLKRNYDPNSDNVFIGHWMRRFLQGGTGFIMSRKAAGIVLQHGEEWIKNMQREDDVELERMREWLNLSPEQCGSPFCFGEEPTMFTDENLWKTNFDKCKKPQEPYSPLYKLADLIALHARSVDVEKAMNNLIKAKKMRNNLYFTQYGTSLLICEGKPYSMDIFDSELV